MIKQPQNVTMRAGGTIAGTLEWSPGFANKFNAQLDKVQRFVDSEVLRLSEPYLPFQTGMLRTSGITGTVIGSGLVSYNAPYARYLYYGKLMVAPSGAAWARSGERKVLTDKALNFHGAPMRGAFWFERMKTDKKAQILRGANQIARSGA